MKVKALKDFRDRENNLCLRKEGELFEAEGKRAKELESRGFVEIVTEKTQPGKKG